METEKPKLIKKAYHVFEKLVGDHHEHQDIGYKVRIRNIARVLIGSIKKFLDDEGMLRAAQISYSLVVSFVPMMVVVLLVRVGISTEKETYFAYAREFIRKNGIPIDPDPYFNIINQLLNNANTITGIGFLVLLFSATSVLRSLERAMNRIWRVKKGRPWIQKISSFLLVLIFGPVLITIGFSIGKSLVNRFAPPNLASMEVRNSQMVITGQKGLFMEYQKKAWKQKDIISHVDFETQKDTVLINSEKNYVLSNEEKEPLLPKIYHPSEKDIRASTLRSFVRKNRRSWIISSNGCILSSRDEKIWDIQCYQREDSKLLFDVRFNKIEMSNDKNGFIVGDNGLILKTTNGGASWHPAYISGMRGDIHDILVSTGGNIFIIGDNFTAYRSEDSGQSWRPVNEIIKMAGKDRASLIRIREFNHSIWITGDYGCLLHSDDGGRSWSRNSLGLTRNELRDVLFISEKKGILIGEEGYIRYTNDGGISWRASNEVTNSRLNFAFYNKQDGHVYIGGDNYQILSNKDNAFHSFYVFQKSPFIRNFLTAIGNLVLPFIFIGIIFFLVYKTMPYTEVINKAAILGAAVTSTLWVVFLMIFQYYVHSFSKGTFAIYGTLAAIPLMLLLVYASVSIMLYGAEIAFFIQNPGLLRLSGMMLKVQSEKRQMWYGLKFLFILYRNYEKGKGATKESELVRICQNDYGEFYDIMEKFIERKFVEKISKNRYTPVMSMDTVMMKEVMDDVDPTDYNIPAGDSDEDFRLRVVDYFQKITRSRSEIFREVTFADLFYGSRTKSPE